MSRSVWLTWRRNRNLPLGVSATPKREKANFDGRLQHIWSHLEEDSQQHQNDAVVPMVTVHPWLADISQPGAFNLGHVRDSGMYIDQ